MRSARTRATVALLAALALAALSLAPTVTAGTWEGLPDLETPRQEIAAAWLDGALYVVGGFALDRSTLASAERWHPGHDAWEPLPDMPVAVNHPAAAAIGGRLVVVGGYAGPVLQNPVDVTQVFDPVTGAWELGTPMPTARGALAAAVLDGWLVAVGGARDGVAVDEVARYDPATGVWEPLPPMPTARDHLGVAVVEGRLHALGGRAGNVFTLRSHEVFDPATGAWTEASPLPTGRSGHAVAAFDGCLYALGGEGNRQRRDGMFVGVERFVVASGTWEVLEPMAVPRHGMGAVPVEGRLLVPGGATVAGFGAVATADALTPPPCGP
jgi:N-acetylneuraminic acid mutarotase